MRRRLSFDHARYCLQKSGANPGSGVDDISAERDESVELPAWSNRERNGLKGFSFRGLGSSRGFRSRPVLVHNSAGPTRAVGNEAGPETKLFLDLHT